MNELAEQKTGQALCFAFGDPEPVLKNQLTDYLGVFTDLAGEYYRPPIDFRGLARLFGANAYHGPILHFKKNALARYFQPSPILSRAELARTALDFHTFGNAYFQRFTNRLGQVTRLGYLPAMPMRRMSNGNQYVKLQADGTRIEFDEGEVIHIKEPEVTQDIYGLPQYVGGIQSLLLSEDSTLFRRKYFVNGAHLGYILVTNDANLDEETAKAIEKAVKDSKGPGNFRSLYLNIPRSSSKEPVQIIPIGNFGSKDEYDKIKEVTEMEMVAMHRVYPNLVAIMPNNTGGFGDIKKTMEVYHELEVVPMQQTFLQLNEIVGRNVVAFREPSFSVNSEQ